ncbi:hypothetical protein H7X87_01880 [Acetobacteraceae bacterium]|nr:hypothetical protein [Candidatus Parcubacteria bacterium]
MRKLMRVVAVAAALLVPTIVYAETITVNVADLPFDVAKQLLLNDTTIGVDLSVLTDDAIKALLAEKTSFTIDDSALPATLRTTLQAQKKIQEVTDTLQVGRDWADMGRAIGIATREGLSAVTEETAKFAETTPGKFTMLMIAWKVMGTDFTSFLLSFVVGIPTLIAWFFVFWWWLRRVYGTRQIRVVDTEGKVTYQVVPPLSVQWVGAQSVRYGEGSKVRDSSPTSDFAILSAFQFVGFVVVMFVILFFVIF